MDAGDGVVPDWRDAAAYEPLLEADCSLIAWEWLRRDPGYREAAARAVEAGGRPGLSEPPERWGLHRFEPPNLAVPEARPVWSAGRHPFVLPVRAEPSPPDPDSFLLETVRRFATLVIEPAGERLLLSDGYRCIRMDVGGASLLSGPVRLSYRLSGMEAAKSALPVLQRFLAFATGVAWPRSHFPACPRARKLVLLLRVCDALQHGADQRTIAGELLSARAAELRWRLNAPSLRSQVQRLVRAARSMASGRFWNLLL